MSIRTVDVVEQHLENLLSGGQLALDWMEEEVPDFCYLQERSWFMENPSLQAKLLEVVSRGLADQVNVFYPEFEWHLENLLSGGQLALDWMEEEVSDFCYLQERSWFMKNPSLQAKLLEVVRLGQGDQVNVFYPEFEWHLDALLTL